MFSYVDKAFLAKLQLMIEAGFIDYKTYIPWCDYMILHTPSPPFWLTELCLAKNPEKAIAILRQYIYSEPFEAEKETTEDFYIACLFLRYRREQEFSWKKFLLEAGQYSDGNEWVNSKDCEYYYGLLNKAERNPALELQQAKEVKELLHKQIHQAELMQQLLQPKLHGQQRNR